MPKGFSQVRVLSLAPIFYKFSSSILHLCRGRIGIGKFLTIVSIELMDLGDADKTEEQASCTWAGIRALLCGRNSIARVIAF